MKFISIKIQYKTPIYKMINTNTDMNSPAYQREKKQTFMICVVVVVIVILLLVFL
uniref:Uncharacterized protein n=1 Tax=viral metagenome TaxID=1070528 RepID=A0A6C0EGX4_9ZZZZ